MLSEVVKVVSIEGGLAHLQLNRPSVLNAINDQVCNDLVATFENLELNEDVSVVVLSGAGERAFSSGADLSHMRSLSGPSLRRFIELTWRAFDRLARSPIMSVAAIDGYALGGGAELALACDIRVAGGTAQFGFPEMTLGSVPGSGAMQRLPAVIGYARALELVTSGRRVLAQEAQRIGMVNWVATDADGETEALNWAKSVAQRPAEAIRYAKVGLRIGTDPTIAGTYQGLVSATCQSAAGYKEATNTFVRPSASPKGTTDGQ